MKTLAIIIGKLLAFAGSLVGKGSATPGAIALKICPDLGEHLVLPKIKIAITGSSGKGSTSALVAGSLKKLGYRVAHNNEGSNMKAGILTMLIKSCSLSGRVKVDVVVAEL
ncbi:MAG: hypothetical protein LBU61_01335, partial [Coriobacteriales bacterium]|nr:hypothetical protein [Coriobacteriales bacterium]